MRISDSRCKKLTPLTRRRPNFSHTRKKMHVYLYMVVYQSRSNEVRRNEDSHTEIILIAFLKLNADTVISYDGSDLTFLDSVLFFK